MPDATTHLQFDAFVTSEDGFHFKVNSDGGNEGRSKGIVGVTKEKGSLTNGGVTDDQQLEHVVEILVGGVFRHRCH